MSTLDNPELLNIMLQDAQQAPDIYKPTNYWSVYGQRFLPELQKLGLKDFRRRRGSILSTFGATDLEPSFALVDLSQSRLFGNRMTRLIPGWFYLLSWLSSLLNKCGYAPVKTDFYGYTIDDLKHSAYLLVRLMGDKIGVKSIDDFEVSLAGNPEDVFEVNGKPYTMRSLYYYLRYIYCAQFIDFERVKVIVELGSGSGKQAEVIKKLHPHITFLLFDIPPQLYVSHQYLCAVFPDAVVDYMTTRNMDTMSEIKAGNIYMFGNWKFPILSTVKIDLFWNAVSFQEMEPNVVANYLHYVNKQADAVFLQQKMAGKEVAKRKGGHGVLQQTKLEHYKSGLVNLELIDMSPSRRPLGDLPGHSDSFWKRIVPASI